MGIPDVWTEKRLPAAGTWSLRKRWKLCALNRKDRLWTDATGLSDTTDLKKFQLDGIVYRLQRRIR